MPKYPIYIPSKGRADRASALTIRALQRDQVPIRLVVEPAQAAAYRKWITGRDQLLVLPDDDYGDAVFARNFIRDHAESEGHARHWQLDDNISIFYRLWEGERIPVHAGVAFQIVEALADRYENVGIAGMNYTMFVPRTCAAPVYRNCHVYSCFLVDHRMPHRWRLKSNDDTDICLQALTSGWATLLVNAVNAQKLGTMTLSGGYTDARYKTGETGGDKTDTHGRYEMAEILRRQWPGIVTVSRKFNRFQHSVDWTKFADVKLRPEAWFDADALPAVNEFGMELVQVQVPRSGLVKDALAQRARVLSEIGCPDPLWRGLPAFRSVPAPPKLVVNCHSIDEREQLIKRLGVSISKRTNGTPSVWWPPRPRNDFGALRFEAGAEIVVNGETVGYGMDGMAAALPKMLGGGDVT